MTKLNLNSSPYYDDFDADKQFYQVLFRPGMSVQARELTQLQSILRDQIAKFGDHIFKHGSIVIPGNSTSDLNICYVKLLDTLYDVTTLDKKYVTGGTSGLRAIIRKGTLKTNTDPTTLFVSYTNSGTSGEKVFIDGEVLTVDGIVDTFTTAPSACGGSSMAFMNKGVFYVNGTFVTCPEQSLVIDKYSTAPSAHVLLKITESIVNSDADPTLLDPAQGSYNYAAPGADRLKITLDFVTLPLGTNITDDYIEIMRFNEGTLEEHARYPRYSELEKSLARRTYDESGDYVVNGLDLSTQEHLRSGLNNGRYTSPIGDANKMLYNVSPGKAYVQGFENEIIATEQVVVDKARTTQVSLYNANPSYGQYFYVTGLLRAPSLSGYETINLTNTSGGTVIATAKVIGIQHYKQIPQDGGGGYYAIYKMFYTDLVYSTSANDYKLISAFAATGSSASGKVLTRNTINMIGFATGVVKFPYNVAISTTAGNASVVIDHNAVTGELFLHKTTVGAVIPPQIGDIIKDAAGNTGKIITSEYSGRNTGDNLLFTLPYDWAKRVKNSSDITDMEYVSTYQVSVALDGSGNGSFSVTGFTINPVNIISTQIFTDLGSQNPTTLATVSPDGLSMTLAAVPFSALQTAYVVCQVTHEGATSAAPKSKTLVVDFTQSGVTPSASVTLSKPDVVRIKSIVSTVNGDVTELYNLFNGQNDYYYGYGKLLLKGTSVPSGTLTIVYDYFTHSPGQYCSIDSYELSGLEDYYNSQVLNYKSPNTGKTYDLRDVVDFRPLITSTSGISLITNDSRITSSFQHYLPRTDIVIIEKDGTIRAVQGTPDLKPVEPNTPTGSLKLDIVKVPAYTFNASDVTIDKIKNRGYTMRAIGKIEDRVAKLEDYVLLSQSENATVSYEVVDGATGLTRYKSGYLVETFLDPDVISDINDEGFKVVYSSGIIKPKFEVVEAPLSLVSHSGRITGSVMTLPYTEVVLGRQPVSSKITNVNPFAVFSWTGSMNISPKSDSWEELEHLPTVFNNATETRNETVVVWRPSLTYTDGTAVGSPGFAAPVQQFFWNDHAHRGR